MSYLEMAGTLAVVVLALVITAKRFYSMGRNAVLDELNLALLDALEEATRTVVIAGGQKTGRRFTKDSWPMRLALAHTWAALSVVCGAVGLEHKGLFYQHLAADALAEQALWNSLQVWMQEIRKVRG